MLSETIKLIFTRFNDETIFISSAVLICVLVILIIYWFHNKRKYNQFLHQIPAGVVKDYLDAVIQNSTALKSSLFRGAGMDVGTGIPSVVPVSSLEGQGGGGASLEVVNQKNAEISSLRTQVLEKDNVIKDLENRIKEFQSTTGDEAEVLGLKQKNMDLEAENKKLKELLENSNSNASSGDSSQEVAALTKERDELKERLLEYEIIEDDLANLKKLQVENEQLKKQLAAGGGSVPEPPPKAKAAAPPPEPAPTKKPEPAPEAPPPEPAPPKPPPEAAPPPPPPKPAEEAPPAEASADSPPPPQGEGEGEEKSAEDLLSEFEKMLG